jgi:hypothetical protein
MKEGKIMFIRAGVYLRGIVARVLARLFYRVADSQIELELTEPEEYRRCQEERRREVEFYLAKYLGPRQ